MLHRDCNILSGLLFLVPSDSCASLLFLYTFATFSLFLQAVFAILNFV